MKRIMMILAAAVCCLAGTVHAQSMEAKLGGNSSSETFTIINADGDTVVVFQADGKAGIGVADPQATLDVGGMVQAESFTGTFLLDTTATSGDLLSFDGTNWIASDLVVGNTGGSQAVNNMQPYLVLNYCISLAGVYPSRSCTNPYIGEIMIVPYNFAPRNWAFCQGQLLAISQYSALFSLLGTMYGGDGRTTFGLPELRGRTVIGAGTGPGLSTRHEGQKSGTEYNYLNTTQLPSHNHTVAPQ